MAVKTAFSPALRFHSRRKSRIKQLPFVGEDHALCPSYWDVPLTGGYVGGTVAGAALAKIFVVHLNQSDGGIADQSLLGWIVCSWLDRALQEAGFAMPDSANDGPEWYDSLYGQVIGFISELQPLLIHLARRSGVQSIDQRAHLKTANDALGAGREQ